MSRKILLAAAALAAVGLAASGARAAAFQNGGFEAGTFMSDGSGADNVEVGTLPGWSFAGVGDVSWDQDGAFSLSAPTAGSHFLDLTGYCDLRCAPGWGGVAQTFDTVAGATYTVTFDLGNDGRYASSGSGVAVTAGDYSGSFVNDLAATFAGTLWQTETFQFKAGASTTLTFVGNLGQSFVGLDNVTVTQNAIAGVPEPASWALMILGFGAAGAALRNRRRGVAGAA